MDQHNNLMATFDSFVTLPQRQLLVDSINGYEEIQQTLAFVIHEKANLLHEFCRLQSSVALAEEKQAQRKCEALHQTCEELQAQHTETQVHCDQLHAEVAAAKAQAEQSRGTPQARFNWLMEELERRFPRRDASTMYRSSPTPEQTVLAAVDALLAQIASLNK